MPQNQESADSKYFTLMLNIAQYVHQEGEFDDLADRYAHAVASDEDGEDMAVGKAALYARQRLTIPINVTEAIHAGYQQLGNQEKGDCDNPFGVSPEELSMYEHASDHKFNLGSDGVILLQVRALPKDWRKGYNPSARMPEEAMGFLVHHVASLSS